MERDAKAVSQSAATSSSLDLFMLLYLSALCGISEKGIYADWDECAQHTTYNNNECTYCVVNSELAIGWRTKAKNDKKRAPKRVRDRTNEKEKEDGERSFRIRFGHNDDAFARCEHEWTSGENCANFDCAKTYDTNAATNGRINLLSEYNSISNANPFCLSCCYC